MLSFFKKKPKTEVKLEPQMIPKNESLSPMGYPIDERDDITIVELIEALISESQLIPDMPVTDLPNLHNYKLLVEIDKPTISIYLPTIIRYFVWNENQLKPLARSLNANHLTFKNNYSVCVGTLLRIILNNYLNQKLNASIEILDLIFSYSIGNLNRWERSGVNITRYTYCTLAEDAKAKGILQPRHLEFLTKDLERYSQMYKPNPKVISRYEIILGKSPKYTPITTDPLGNALARTLRAEPDKPWGALLLHLHQTQGKPNAKALKQAAVHLENIGNESFLEQFSEWARTVTAISLKTPTTGEPIYSLLAEPNQQLLAALVTLAGTVGTAETATEIAQIAAKAMTKIPGVGPAATGLGNQCIRTLAAMPGGVGLPALAGLAPKLKQAPKPTQAILKKELDAAAARAGTTVAALQDSLVPTFAMSPDATATHIIGPYTATLRARDLRTAELEWAKDGKPLKSLPTGAKNEFPEETAHLKAQQKELQTTLATLRDRLDSSYLSPAPVPFADFEARWLAHPLLGAFARALIWRVTPPEGAPFSVMWGVDGAGITATGEAAPAAAPTAAVELWHPLHSPTEETLAWRSHLERAELAQPIKQAFREVYVLTPAEVNTHTYSNRMAAHIIRQHQFNALAKVRGWSFPLQGAWDGNNDSIARRLLPHWGLEAQFWVDAVWGEGNNWEEYTVDSGVLRYVATDQIRFLGTDGQVRTVAEIPPVVFSEVMRDADLFVGVASVGNNPNWQDAGPEARFHDYWQSYSFGDLTATAHSRKELLQRLIPRLAIAPKCSFSDKFLVVRGTRHLYKIHLGSGNIMMEPGDRYLCIVPSRTHNPTASQRVFLPFEGDSVFSIILSKAVLLAADDKITDDSILRQLEY